MDKHPLDRDAIRALADGWRLYSMPLPNNVATADALDALLDLLEQTERDLETQEKITIARVKERDVARRERDDEQLKAKVAAREALRAMDERDAAEAEVARLTEERAYYRQMADEKGRIIFDLVLTREAAEARVLRLQTVLTDLISECDSQDNGYVIHTSNALAAAREVLAAVPVVPDPPIESVDIGES